MVTARATTVEAVEEDRMGRLLALALARLGLLPEREWRESAQWDVDRVSCSNKRCDRTISNGNKAAQILTR